MLLGRLRLNQSGAYLILGSLPTFSSVVELPIIRLGWCLPT